MGPHVKLAITGAPATCAATLSLPPEDSQTQHPLCAASPATGTPLSQPPSSNDDEPLATTPATTTPPLQHDAPLAATPATTTPPLQLDAPLAATPATPPLQPPPIGEDPPHVDDLKSRLDENMYGLALTWKDTILSLPYAAWPVKKETGQKHGKNNYTTYHGNGAEERKVVIEVQLINRKFFVKKNVEGILPARPGVRWGQSPSDAWTQAFQMAWKTKG